MVACYVNMGFVLFDVAYDIASFLIDISWSRGSEVISPHGMPLDLLDRTLIIKTLPYAPEEITQILSIRAQVEHLNLAPDALAQLATIGVNTSLRYAVQLLTPGQIISRSNGRESITKDDVDEVRTLFLDAKASAKILAENADNYLR
jgi:RuvB-like protein 1 (pontin 52)